MTNLEWFQKWAKANWSKADDPFRHDDVLVIGAQITATADPKWLITLSLRKTICLQCSNMPEIIAPEGMEIRINTPEGADDTFNIECDIDRLDEALGVVRQFITKLDDEYKQMILTEAAKL